MNKFIVYITSLILIVSFPLLAKFAWDEPSFRQQFMFYPNVLVHVVKMLNEHKDDKQDEDDTKPKRRR